MVYSKIFNTLKGEQVVYLNLGNISHFVINQKGVRKIDFLKNIDIINFGVTLIILAILILRISYFHKKELIIWLPGIIVLTFVMFIQVNDTLMGKYLFSAISLTYALISSAFMIQIDKNKKFSIYYTFGSIVLALFTAFTIHFGSTVNRVLTEPLFLAIMLISLLVIIIVSIIALTIKKVKLHIIWSAISWVIIGIAVLFQIKIVLFVGILCLSIFFIYSKQH